MCISKEPPKFPHTLMLDDALIAHLCRVDPFDPNSPIKQLEITCGSPSCHCHHNMTLNRACRFKLIRAWFLLGRF